MSIIVEVASFFLVDNLDAISLQDLSASLATIEKYKLEIDEELDEIKDAVNKHQKKLMAAIAGIENEKKEMLSMTQKIK